MSTCGLLKLHKTKQCPVRKNVTYTWAKGLACFTDTFITEMVGGKEMGHRQTLRKMLIACDQEVFNVSIGYQLGMCYQALSQDVGIDQLFVSSCLNRWRQSSKYYEKEHKRMILTKVKSNFRYYWSCLLLRVLLSCFSIHYRYIWIHVFVYFTFYNISLLNPLYFLQRVTFLIIFLSSWHAIATAVKINLEALRPRWLFA